MLICGPINANHLSEVRAALSLLLSVFIMYLSRFSPLYYIDDDNNARNSQKINGLKNYIRAEIQLISAAELLKDNNFIKRCLQCVVANGGHFQHQILAAKAQIPILHFSVQRRVGLCLSEGMFIAPTDWEITVSRRNKNYCPCTVVKTKSGRSLDSEYIKSSTSDHCAVT